VPFLGFESLKSEPGPLHLAIGIFDGVHLGHQAILKQASGSAAEDGGKAVALTFWPHPSRVLCPEKPVPMLIDRTMRERFLRESGAFAVTYIEFTPEFASMEAQAFPAFIKRAMPSLKTISVGEGFRFGRGRAGDANLLCIEGARVDLDVRPLVRVDMDGLPISSTRIRENVSAGEIAKANRLLGRPYIAEGRIVSGDGLGRKIGVPTFNLEWSPDLNPRLGVYAVWCGFPGFSDKPFAGVANYGSRPTIAGECTEPRLEVHLLGDPPPSPVERMEVAFHEFIRPEMKFDSLEELAKRIEKDVEIARKLLVDS
jgi:riboflavin kinase/FMN adenylyltransferase